MQSYVYDGHSNYYNYTNDPRLNYSCNLSNFAPSNREIEQKTDDELYIENWLSKIGKIQIKLDSTIEITPSRNKCPKRTKPNIKLSALKLSLKKCLQVIAKLEEIRNDLKTNVSTMSSVEWKRKTIEIGSLKDEFSSLTAQFENADLLTSLKRTVQQRKKKRLNHRRRKAERREEMTKEKNVREEMHKDIDRWLENMKEAVEKTKMEENMKKDADCVLAEVTKKKSDARKQLSLISALMKLRNVRESAAKGRGEKTSTEDGVAFEKVSDKLTQMWENTMKVYAKEEQGLRVMLEKNAIEDDKLQMCKEERTIREWDYYLFGPKEPFSPVYWGLTSAEKDLETFIAIRKSWDTFLTTENDVGASKIPIGWVLPSVHSNEHWTQYRCNTFNS